MGTLHGRHGQVWFSAVGSSTLYKIGEARSYRIQTDWERDDFSAIGDTAKRPVPSMFSWSGEIECNLDPTQLAFVWALAVFDPSTITSADDAPWLRLVFDENATSGQYYCQGKVWPKLTFDVSNNVERVTVDFEGVDQPQLGP